METKGTLYNPLHWVTITLMPKLYNQLQKGKLQSDTSNKSRYRNFQQNSSRLNAAFIKISICHQKERSIQGM